MVGNDKVKVRIANGDHVDSNGKVLGVNVNIQGFNFKVDIYILVLVGCDMVLGVQWLKNLGAILLDFNKLTMEFKQEQKAAHKVENMIKNKNIGRETGDCVRRKEELFELLDDSKN